MYYKKYPSDDGSYIDESGQLWCIHACNAAHTPQGLNVGYTLFDDEAAMMRAWGLSLIPNSIDQTQPN